MKFSVCVESVFDGCDFAESMKEIKNAGIDTIEFWTWDNKNIEAIKSEKESLGINIAGFCTKYFNLVNPDNREQYLSGLKESIEIAKRLNVTKLITQVGDEIKDVSREAHNKSIIDGLKACAPILEESGVTLLAEPLNTFVDHIGYYLYSSGECAEIIRTVNSPNVKMLFDIYHQQIMEGNLISNITKYFDCIGHFHAAGNPGRNEIYKGEINYKNIFEAIDSLGYKGFMGLEYFTKENPTQTIKDILSYLS